jgi:hypothetical protein
MPCLRAVDRQASVCLPSTPPAAWSGRRPQSVGWAKARTAGSKSASPTSSPLASVCSVSLIGRPVGSGGEILTTNASPTGNSAAAHHGGRRPSRSTPPYGTVGADTGALVPGGPGRSWGQAAATTRRPLHSGPLPKPTPQASFGARRRGHRSSPDGGYRSPGAFLGSRLFRPLMREMLVAAHDAGRLQFLPLSPQGDVLRTISRRTPGARLLTASVVWPGAWRGPIGIKAAASRC